MRLPKGTLAARIRADLAEKKIASKDLAHWTERSLKTIERWRSDAPQSERYRPTRAEAIVLAYLTGYPLSRYTGDVSDDILFPLDGVDVPFQERLRSAKANT
jgi:hypothetical protein